jgi:hypothetical protein
LRNQPGVRARIWEFLRIAEFRWSTERGDCFSSNPAGRTQTNRGSFLPARRCGSSNGLRAQSQFTRKRIPRSRKLRARFRSRGIALERFRVPQSAPRTESRVCLLQQTPQFGASKNSRVSQIASQTRSRLRLIEKASRVCHLDRDRGFVSSNMPATLARPTRKLGNLLAEQPQKASASPHRILANPKRASLAAQFVLDKRGFATNRSPARKKASFQFHCRSAAPRYHLNRFE